MNLDNILRELDQIANKGEDILHPPFYIGDRVYFMSIVTGKPVYGYVQSIRCYSGNGACAPRWYADLILKNGNVYEYEANCLMLDKSSKGHL